MTNTIPSPPADTDDAPVYAAGEPAPFMRARHPSGPEDSRRPAFFRGHTWRAFGYHWTALLLAPFGFTYAVTAVSLGASLAITVVGLIAAAAMIAAARGWGALHRRLTASLLGVQVTPPPPFAPKKGFFGFLRSGLTDGAGWRALTHMELSFVTSLISAILSVTVLVTGVGCLTHWYWYQWLPPEETADGGWHRGGLISPGTYIDGVWWQLVYIAVGLLLTLGLWPALNNGAGRVQALLAAALLGPTGSQQRVQDLEDSRSSSVQDADARLQQIERDLHDGTQAQLVSIAMKLGDARDRLAAPDAPAGELRRELLHLMDSAHGTAKDALVDLRSLARGIRPAVLNDGLDTALESLAGTAPLPVRLAYVLPSRPSPAVEAIAYYCAAELINNAVKHSGATEVSLRVSPAPEAGGLQLQVLDNGSGGADAARGTGLAGLADRVRTVDGSLRVRSPAGGPTMVTVHLPFS